VFSSTIEKFDRDTRRELGVSDAAWIRQTGPTIEMRWAENLEPLATATDEGHQSWCVRRPDEVVFCGDPLLARRLLWEVAAAAPTRPTTAATPAPPRSGWDYYARAD
jgi:hypothetical protein